MKIIKLEGSDFTKYEKTRIIGARALQLSMGAPFLVKISEKKLEELKYNPIEIAKLEFEAGVIPLQVKRELPGEKLLRKHKAGA